MHVGVQGPLTIDGAEHQRRAETRVVLEALVVRACEEVRTEQLASGK